MLTQWSEKYKLNFCKDCKATNKPHHGKGYCETCYGRYLYKKSSKRRKNIVKFNKRWLKKAKRKPVNKPVDKMFA